MQDRILAAPEEEFIIWNTLSVQAPVFEAYLAVLNDELGHAALQECLREVYTPLLQPVVGAASPSLHTSARVGF